MSESTFRDSGDDELRRAAPKMAHLLRDDSWVHRVVESIEFVDESRVRRRLSLDFTLPIALRDSPICIRDCAYIPMLTLKKAVMKGLDVVDGEGRVVSVLNSHENGVLSGEVLVEQARYAGTSVTTGLEAFLRTMAAGPRRGDSELLRATQEFDLTDEERQTIQILGENEHFWLSRLAADFLLVGRVKIRPGDRAVVKATYEQDDVRIEGGYGLFDTPALLRSEHYHLEMIAPEDTVIAAANLQVSAEVVVKEGMPTFRRNWVDGATRADRVHLYGRRSRIPEDILTAQNKEVWAFVWIRPRPWVVEPLLLVSCFITGLFIAGDLVHYAKWSDDVPSVTAVVVAFPALAAGYYASSEHRLAQKLLRGVQRTGFLCAANSFGAAAALVLRPAPGREWTPPAISWIGMLVLTCAIAFSSSMIRELTARVFTIWNMTLSKPGTEAPGKLLKRLQDPRSWKTVGLCQLAASVPLIGFGVGPKLDFPTESPRGWLWLFFGALAGVTTGYLFLAWSRALYNTRRPSAVVAMIEE